MEPKIYSLPAQEIKRRGISAVDEGLKQGAVYIIKNNRPKYVVLDEAHFRELLEATHNAGGLPPRRLIDRLDELKAKILPLLLPHGVEEVSLFGSAARGEESAASDIDILVRLAPASKRRPLGLKWFGLQEDLSRALGRPVDLVSERYLSPYLRPFVEREKIVLYAKN